MRGERQMNKNSQRLEDGASGSPYVNRCGEYTIEVEFAGSSSLESCIAAYLNEKYRKFFLKIVFQKGPADSY